MKRTVLALLGAACMASASVAFAQVTAARNVAAPKEDCRCSSCSPGDQDCVYITCSGGGSGMCKGKYNDT